MNTGLAVATPRQCQVVFADMGGGPATKGSMPLRRLAVLAGQGDGPLVLESTPRQLAILAGLEQCPLDDGEHDTVLPDRLGR